MTSYQGIAVVTRTLAYLVGTAIRPAVQEATVSTLRPEEPAAADKGEPRVNVYLVNVAPDAALRHQDLPTRTADGTLVAVPTIPLNLRYLLSFFGPTEQAHLMLGAVEVWLRASPLLDPHLIGQAIEQTPALHGSGLEAQQPPVRLAPATVPLEELARFWSGFQVPYTLSTVVDAGSVVLSAAVTPSAALPVHKGPTTDRPPAPSLDPFPAQPFAPGDLVPVAGRGLEAGDTLTVAGTPATLATAAGHGLAFTLPRDAPPGVQPVSLGGTSQAIGIRPVITEVTKDGAVTAKLTAGTHAGQSASLSLFTLDPAESGAPASATLTTTIVTPGTEIAFSPTPDLPAGRYLALVEVDGISSLPVVDAGRYVGPAVVLG